IRNLSELVKSSSTPADHSEWITQVIAAVVREDLDFTHTDHARFDSICFQYWPPYHLHQQENMKENLYVLGKYAAALDDLSGGKPDFVRSINFEPDGVRGVPSHVEEKDITYLTRLVAGYGYRRFLLPDSEKELVTEDFKAKVLQNASLTRQMVAVTPSLPLGTSPAQGKGNTT